jgi:peroxiredoxin
MANLTGRPAIPFALPDSTERLHRLEDYRGRWLLLVFHRHLG